MQSEEINNIHIETKPKGKRLKKVLLWVLVTFLVLLTIPVILVFVYQKEIKEQIVNELNKHLKVKVYINPNDIDFTLIKTFPKAAVYFKNVTVMGSLPDIQDDTLLKAQSVYLLFNAKDIWNKKYIINQITIKNAALKVLVNDLGEPDYEIWKTDENSTKEKSTAFKLNKIVLDDFSFTYKNYQNKVKLVSEFKEVMFSGNFANAAYELSLNAQGFISSFKSKKVNYIKDKNVNIDLLASVNNNSYNISKAEVALNKLFFSVNGSFTNTDSVMPCNIVCKGKNVDIQSVLSLLPEKFHDKIKNYESDGVFYAEASINGDLRNYHTLSIHSSFGITNASVTYIPLSTKLNKVNFTGSFVKEKYKTEILVLKNIHAQQNQNYVEGNLELTSFNTPHLTFAAKGKYNLQDFFSLVPLDTLASSKGLIDFDLNAELNINELSAKKNDAGFVNGKVKLSDVDLTFRNGKTIQIPEGLIKIEKDNISTEDLKIIHQTSSLLISGKATNLLNYLFKENQNLYVDADITSPVINVNDFLYEITTETASDKAPESKQKIIAINKNISAIIKLNIDKIEFNGFSAKNFAGILELKNRKMLAKNFSFAAFDGDITLNGIADASDTNFVKISCSTNLIDVDIHKMFNQLNNFGQSTIIDKNLQGKATAQIDFSATWNDRLVCDVASVLVGADLTIDKGELIDFASLESLSKYIELKELKRIKFSTLETHVDIRNNIISFSKTEVSNSALNLDVWGTHSFNNEIDYHIKLLLSEYLAKRPGKSRQMDEELLENQNDPESKRCVFIHMTGTTDKPIIKYDRKAMKQKIKQDLKEEKKNLKRLLKEEFGFFKKDTTLSKDKDNKKQDQNFKIDFKQDDIIEKPKPGAEDDDF